MEYDVFVNQMKTSQKVQSLNEPFLSLQLKSGFYISEMHWNIIFLILIFTS